MKLRFLSLLVTVLPLAEPLSASTISVSDFSGSGATFVENQLLTSTGGTLVNGGTLVRVGFFTDLSATVTTALGSPDKNTVYNALSTYFVGLGEGVDADLGTPASGGPRIVQRTVNGTSQAGRLFGNIDGVNPGVYNPPSVITGVAAGTRLFVLVYNTSTAAAASELAIFSADDDAWKMPSDPLLNLTLNTVLVNNSAEIFRGSQGSIRLAVLVPEPSASLLALGAMALGLRRRR